MILADAIKLLKEQREAGYVVVDNHGRVRLTTKGMLAAVEKWIKENNKWPTA